MIPRPPLKSPSVGSLSICLAAAGAIAIPAFAAPLTLKPGDHVALVGNATADRMQHHNGLETLLTQRFAAYNLTFRNLAAPGDEVVTRSRSENFGSPDDWLNKTKASVIFGFFGFNESFKGYDGLPGFKADLEKWLKETKAKDFSGSGQPRIVLFSPLAIQKLPDFPDPASQNAILAQYAAAMAEVAKAQDVGFVDLFALSEKAYAGTATPLTHNGWQLTEAGDSALAPQIFQALTGEAAPAANAGTAKLRSAIADKNWQWHQRYRTVDGYNVYGGRSQLSYESGPGGPKITNYKVMQEEMGVRDVMTANRDQRVWAVARGGDLTIDDSNIPKVTEVKTNKPGSLPDGAHVFLSGEAAIAKMKVHDGCEVNLFASEEQFPDLINPVQMAWDTRGRLWVSAWRNYPERTPWSPKGDSLLVFEDTNGDGRADKVTPFLDDLNCPTGFQFYKDGVLVMQAPDVWFVRDTDGDGRGDSRELVLMGMDSADSHHTTNAMALDPGGAVYLSDGVFHRTQVETARGPVRTADGALFRFEPRTGEFETYVKYGFANPHGKVFDRWGNDLVTDATGNATYFAPAFSGHLDHGDHRGLREFWARPSRPCPGTGRVSSRHFPDDWQGNFLNCNVISFQGIFRVKVSEEGSGLRGDSEPDLVSSEDPNFRPSAVSVGPDGAIYFCDWSNAIIGHMQHHLRDPNRDHQHGRVYRITYKGRPLLTPPAVAGEPIDKLLELLKSPEDGVRERAKIELGARDTSQVIAATRKWLEALDPADPQVEHHKMEALWVHQWHHAMDALLLKTMLRSPEPRARAAATRVLGYWRHDLPKSLALSLLAPQATDEHPRVRLEAVRVASFFDDAEAATIALSSLTRPSDYYLDYTLGETIRQLEPYWRKAIANGQPLAANNPAGIDFLLKSVTTAELLKLPRTATVLNAILWRPDVASASRLEAITTLADQNKTSIAAEIVGVMKNATPAQTQTASDLGALLPAQGADSLKPLRADLGKLAVDSPIPVTRAIAAAGCVVADGDWEPISKAVPIDARHATTLLNAVAFVPDMALRAKADSPVRRLLAAPRETLAARLGVGPGAPARFVRIELPRRGTLTLAEVEVFSGGQNIARRGSAKQSSTSNGGVAARAIDGNTSPVWGQGGQTHSQENEDHPWWELDLGQDASIDAITIYNRQDGGLHRRLDGFTLTVLDASRQVVFEKKGVPAPVDSVRIEVEADPVSAVREAAIRTLPTTGVEPAQSFVLLCGLLEKGEARSAVVGALHALPRTVWQTGAAGSAARAVLGWAKTVPAGERTAPAFVETLQLALEFSGLQTDDAGRALARDLRSLSVNVFVIHTVREQMRYDTPRLVVEAGKPFEIIFENNDMMPHNLVIGPPGSRDAIAAAAQVMPPTQLDGQGRAYIPPAHAGTLIAASRMVEAGQRETLKVTAPSQPGEYDYVCTFPGHAMLMNGRMVVVSDVDAYLRDHPTAAR